MAVAIPFLPPHVNDLLFWRDPVASGKVLASVVGVWLLFSGVLPHSLFSYLLVTFLFVSAVFLLVQSAMGYLGRDLVKIPAVFKEGISESAAKDLVSRNIPYVNKALSFIGKLASGKDVKLSAATGAGLFVAAYIMRFISVLTFAFVVVLLAFSLPKAYELKKDEVDRVVAQLLSKVKELYAKVEDAVFKKAPKAQAQAQVPQSTPAAAAAAVTGQEPKKAL
mmetsp:Transcript_36600/g.81461  ORF Transcript_36600/g.81461 Transcript_36600/m.81461 type:complete len:222 (+) Transcript_36600:208-873(+)|eukprot:CAMPEP_0202900014 /NCGR_PEP_ID=MMETSP1392-20130828/9414_1 /ASSEMBLY_ACC=CAM_ASM_000868 /TAXON_ID=225041 /ORGANISM="Chlamydomonas chlamydogama, Strain SAG 11-48b" /LENGTH=221 /DNA_ID=CAMNT_0049586325 /DNA_START=206 /DNA_END=871 /DNA_ORIENTATION=+